MQKRDCPFCRRSNDLVIMITSARAVQVFKQHSVPVKGRHEVSPLRHPRQVIVAFFSRPSQQVGLVCPPDGHGRIPSLVRPRFSVNVLKWGARNGAQKERRNTYELHQPICYVSTLPITPLRLPVTSASHHLRQ